MTKFKRTLGKMAILAAFSGVFVVIYLLFFVDKTALEDRIVLAVVLGLCWILPTTFVAIYFLTEKLTISSEKIVIKTLFKKKEFLKSNLKGIKLILGDPLLRKDSIVCLVPNEVPDTIMEGRGDNYVLLTKKDKRITRFPIDDDSKLLMKKCGWKI